MGGKSTSDTTQQSQTNPWQPAQPFLTGILGQLQQGLGGTGLTGAESGALSGITANAANAGQQFSPQVSGIISNLLGGGGATGVSPMINQAYADYQRRLAPTADATGISPGLQSALDTLRSDVTNQVNGQFAAGGRDFSGMNQQALARGITQGAAPLLAQDLQNRMNAAGSLYNAGNTTGGLLSGINQQALANAQQGVATIPQLSQTQNTGNNAILQAEAARRGIPVQALGLLAQIGVPIAGLGSQSSGTSNTTNQMSGAQQFGLIAQGLGNILSNFGVGKAFPKIF